MKMKLIMMAMLLSVASLTAQDFVLISEDKTYYASSVEHAGLLPPKSFDGDEETRWSSTFSDNQWLKVDLGESLPIDKIVLKWEEAYATDYKIWGSNDPAQWGSVLVDNESGQGNIEEFTQAYGEYQYIVIELSDRATPYGFSLFEVEIYSEEQVPSNTFVDERDGREYKKASIGNQTWMAENLNFVPTTTSHCYNNWDVNCDIYGRLYNWDDAMVLCPVGWHLPSMSEWQELWEFAKAEHNEPQAGILLKSVIGWDGAWQGEGTDVYGFEAYAGGFRGSNGFSSYLGERALWWSASTSDVAGQSWYMELKHWTGWNTVWRRYVGEFMSVRCVEDEI